MRTRRSGSALLTVLWLTAALSAIGLAVAGNVRGETERTSTGVDDTRAYFIARGAIERAALHILWRGITDDLGHPIYFRSGQPQIALDFPAAQVVVDVIPETAKLNLNAIRPDELLVLLAGLGVPEDHATEITSAILDWRAPVDPLHPSVFDGFYLEQSPSFLPPHASFKENEELLQIKGMTPGIYYGETLGAAHAGLRDCVSVYGSTYSVDVNGAAQATLQAVGVSPEDAVTIVKNRAEHPIADYLELSSLQRALGPGGARLTLGGSTIYTLRATARLKTPEGKLSDLRRTIAALVKFNFPGNTKGRATGIEILRWFDRT